MAETPIKFGDFELDYDRFLLSRAGRGLKLEKLPMELLILLAKKNGNLVTRSEIVERLWGKEVFVDSEHGINTAIRKIRQALRDDPEEPRFIETVIGKGYRFIAPVTIPEGVRHSEESAGSDAAAFKPAIEPAASAGGEIEVVDRGPDAGVVFEARPAFKSRKLFWLAILVTLLVVGVLFLVRGLNNFGWRERFVHSRAMPQIKSLAVIPLDNLSGDPGQEYFADGMTDELITMLAKNSTLRVVSRTSVMQYKGVHRPLREIAKALGVDGILEGSISRSGDKVHMTIQLIEAPSDTHVWAESYDRDLQDVASLPREAAVTIAKRLNSGASRPALARYVSPEAHDAYLRGRYLWYLSAYDKAGEYFKKATELQPDYAVGWSGVSVNYGAGAIEGEFDPRKALAPQKAAAAKAVQLDDSLAEAHLALGASYFENEWNWDGSLQEVGRATELDPNFSEAYHFRAKVLAALNRHDEAIDAQKKATGLDPFARPWALAYSYLLARRYDAALAEAQQRLEANPGDADMLGIVAGIYGGMGMFNEALPYWEKSYRLGGDAASADALHRAFLKGGQRAVLRWQLSHLEKESATHYVSPVDVAAVYAQLGDREHTLGLLEEGYRQHSPLLLWIQCDPAFDFLHGDERYRAIIRKAGLPPAW